MRKRSKIYAPILCMEYIGFSIFTNLMRYQTLDQYSVLLAHGFIKQSVIVHRKTCSRLLIFLQCVSLKRIAQSKIVHDTNNGVL